MQKIDRKWLIKHHLAVNVVGWC